MTEEVYDVKCPICKDYRVILKDDENDCAYFQCKCGHEWWVEVSQ